MPAAASKTSPKKAAKKPAPKKASHPSYQVMVEDAIKVLKDRKGSSRQAMKKQIMATHNLPAVSASHFKLALDKLTESGTLVKSENGQRWKIKKVAVVKKPAVKKSEAKKTVTKKAAPKSPKKSAVKTSPKKTVAKKVAAKKAAKKPATKKVTKKPAAKKTTKKN